MMTRQINKEFWKSEGLADITHTQRLLFIGLWCMADREGLLKNQPRRIAAEIFPYDSMTEKKIKENLYSLDKNNLIEYGVDKDGLIAFICITNFNEYQSPHPGEKQSKLASEYIEFNYGENKIEIPAAKKVDREGKRAFAADAKEVLAHLNQVTGKSFKMTRNIIERMRVEDASVEDCKLVIDSKWKEWKDDPAMKKYVDAVTLWRPSKFAGYLDNATADHRPEIKREVPKHLMDLNKGGE